MKTLGLDLGTNSVGWAIVTDAKADALATIEAGVYIFPEAAELNDGLYESNRRLRGQKRRMRRNLARKRQRRDKLVAILRENDLYEEDASARKRLFDHDKDADGVETHPYALRKRGLDQALTLTELGRALYHICRRRGYLSTALLKLKHLQSLAVGRSEAEEAEKALDADNDSGADDAPAKATDEAKERSALKARMAEVRKQIGPGGARTLGEFYADQLGNRVPVRGIGPDKLKKRADGSRKDALGLRAERRLFEDEFHMLWDSQARFHPTALTGRLKMSVYEAIFAQKPLRRTDRLVGKCEFLPNHHRAARASLVAQQTSLLQSIVNLRVREQPGDEERRLTPDEIGKVLRKLHDNDFVTWIGVKTAVGLPQTARFSEEPTGGKGPARRTRKGLAGNQTAKRMRAAIGAKWSALNGDQQEDLVNRLLAGHEFSTLIRGLRRSFGFTDAELYRLAVLELPEGYVNHCARVLRKIEPWLRDGHVYSEACEKAGYREPNTSTERAAAPAERLTFDADLKNPIVQRSVQMAVRVINAVIAKYGKPDRIRIEMPRDVSKTNKQRELTWRSQDANARENERARKLLVSNDLPLGVNEINVKKVRLWQEAGERCPYFPSRSVTLIELVHEFDIDHIVPRSRCYDDSWGNLTICPHSENQLVKGKQTPWEAYANRWPEIEGYVKRLGSMPVSKRERILQKEWDATEFTKRALSDTRYVSRVILEEVKKLGVEVQVSRGQLTSLLRSAWELGGCLPRSEEEQLRLQGWQAKSVKKDPKPRYDHRHHAVDAIVIALTDTRTLQSITKFLQQREAGFQSNRVEKPKPWPTFSEDVKRIMEEECSVVHAPTRGIAGPLHQETARRPPTRQEVERVMAAMPEADRSHVRNCVVVGGQLVWLGPDGTPVKAYDLRSNHHAVIWESQTPDKSGAFPRDIEVVTMIEASRRATRKVPVINRTRDGWKYVMSFCENDIVEWTGDDPGLKRVATFSIGAGGGLDLVMRPLVDARANKATQTRVTGRAGLRLLIRRVCLDPLGDILSSEPAERG